MLKDIDNSILKRYFAVQEIPQAAEKDVQRLADKNNDSIQENRALQLQKIIQVADYIITTVIKEQGESGNLYRKSIINTMEKLAQHRELDAEAAMSAIRRFGIIEKRVQMETRNYLEMYVNINNRYKILLEGTLGEYNS